NIFAERLAHLMKERDINQTALADAIGSCKQSISMYVNAHRVPDIDVFKKICEFFNVSADYMLGIETDGAILTKQLMEKINDMDRKLELIKELINE
ncbi:MAG: hypothetical protein CVU92_11410, partial [Firmicutes bacterium HGW-Firmicutes-17]